MQVSSLDQTRYRSIINLHSNSFRAPVYSSAVEQLTAAVVEVYNPEQSGQIQLKELEMEVTEVLKLHPMSPKT